MPTKKKVTKPHIGIPDEDTGVGSSERVTVVTEIVEVTEEKPQDTGSTQEKEYEEKTSDMVTEDDDGETAASEEQESHMTPSEMNTDEDTMKPVENKIREKENDEKRKEVVEELFKPDDTHMMPEISVHKENTSKTMVLWGIIVIVAALVIGIGLFIVSKRPYSLPLLTANPTATPTPTVAPTPEPVDRDMLTIQVLNGGGTPGAAGTMKSFLEQKGYKVTDTGNTDEYTYDKTEILVKPSKQPALSLLEGDLGETYELGTVSATLSEGVLYDARVTVGKQ